MSRMVEGLVRFYDMIHPRDLDIDEVFIYCQNQSFDSGGGGGGGTNPYFSAISFFA